MILVKFSHYFIIILSASSADLPIVLTQCVAPPVVGNVHNMTVTSMTVTYTCVAGYYFAEFGHQIWEIHCVTYTHEATTKYKWNAHPTDCACMYLYLYVE